MTSGGPSSRAGRSAVAAGGSGPAADLLDLELAIYLASRPDLFSVEACLVMEASAGAPTSAGPMPAAVLDDLLAAELGAKGADLFEWIDSEPTVVAPLFELRRARLGSGEEVAVKTSRPGSAEWVDGSEERRRHLERRLARRSETAALDRAALARDFEDWLAAKLDLADEARCLSDLAAAKRPWFHAAPKVFERFCSATVRTSEWLGGIEPVVWAASASAPRRAAVARRVAKAWLRQTLTEGLVPLDPGGEALAILEDGRVAFVEGPFARLVPGARANLEGYLAAVAAGDPIRALDFLRPEIEGLAADDERRLRHRMRYLAPFRDGGWLADGDRLGQAVLGHWRLLTDLGLRSSGPLASFHRAWYRLTRTLRDLAPGEDALVAAFQEHRLRGIAESIGRWRPGDRESWSDVVESQLPAMVELPARLDRFLDRVGREAVEVDGEPAAAQRSEGQPWTTPLALLLAIAGVALLADRLGAVAWAEPAGALVVVALGGAFLWVSRRL